LSESIQDYLKTIYELHRDQTRATTNALAARLRVEAASVTGMLKKLAELKLVDYVPYQGAQLTPSGEKIALEVIRHHRLLELYLMEAMGFTWDQVHDEADRLEHAISEEFEDKIATLLGDPKVDPHGDPIPSKTGEVAETSRHTLLMTQSRERVRVQRVRDEDPELLRRMAELGLTPGAVIEIVESANNDDDTSQTRIARADGKICLIDQQLADSVFVTALP
jgi:DtxR family transcriptional regulator, Mn-dependent transcriptional regulator